MSIIDPKYRDKYRDNHDWLTNLINENFTSPVMRTRTVKDEDGKETVEAYASKKTQMDLGAFMAFAEENHLDVKKYRAQMDQPTAPGRLRMTVGNMLRAAAKKRHGLKLNGNWHKAPAEFLDGHELTHNPDGSKIEKPKEAEKDAA